VSSTPVPKLLIGTAAACAALLVALLLAPRAAGPIGSASPTPSVLVSASPSELASASPSPTATASPNPTATATPTYLLTVVVDGAENGKVVSVPAGIDCPTTCSARFPKGTRVVLTPVAGPTPSGYDQTWLDWAERCAGAGTTCEITMVSDYMGHATFHLRPSAFGLQVIIVGPADSGFVTSTPAGINCGSTCFHAYAFGTRVDLMAVARPGYQFAGWSGPCTGTGSCTIELGAPTDVPAVEVTARFEPVS
jgi:uncharacterized repeat protein (TIGR02543 family)